MRYIYQYKDHLGNVRLSYSKNATTGLIAIEDTNDYYPFGLSFINGGASKYSPSTTYKNYKYNGKELQETGIYDYGARFYMPDIGRFGILDRFSEKNTNLSPYHYAVNNPIMFIDKNGDYAVSVHYRITYEAFINAGYSKKDADLYAHYASTYSDNPPNHASFLDFTFHPSETKMHLKRKGIDYSSTRDSQDEKNSMWHSMMSNDEHDAGMTREKATLRGLQFGWNNIFASKGKNLGKIGQGLHALQDAIAHGGASTDEHLGKNLSSASMMYNDMYGSTKEAEGLTKTATAVIDLLQGKTTNLKDGDKLDTRGMSKDQMGSFLSNLINSGFTGKITFY